MRLLVCGGRNFTNSDEKWVFSELDQFHAKTPITLLIDGDARGVDRIAGKWATIQGIERMVFPADWGKYGTSAGPIRNAQMLKEGLPNIVMAFPGGKGTANMISQAVNQSIQVIRVLL